ncbi:hypothetical protein TNCV_1958401 [Trichonephila clavipes]|nr:hypothetical protein TNCV_1958401 [Trichonephila clavipes]
MGEKRPTHAENVVWTNKSRFALVHADGWVQLRRKPFDMMDTSCQLGANQLSQEECGFIIWRLFTWTGMEP